MTPPVRTSKSRPVGATQIVSLGRLQEKKLVGARKSAPPAKERWRPLSSSPRGLGSRVSRRSRRQGRRQWRKHASRSQQGPGTRVLLQQRRRKRRRRTWCRWCNCRRAATSLGTRGTSILLLRPAPPTGSPSSCRPPKRCLARGRPRGPVTGRSSSPGSPWSFSATSRRRKRSGRRRLRLALGLWTTSIAPWSSIERRISRSAT